MKPGDLVQFKPITTRLRFFPDPKYRIDHLDQRILAGTRGLIIGQEVAECLPGEEDPLNEFPYTMFTVLTEKGVVTSGWTENVFTIITDED